MRIIIAGAGEVGTHLAKMLSSHKHDITVIDTDEDKLTAISSHFDILTVLGSCTSFEKLKETGIKKSDLFISVTHTEEINITAALLGKKLGAKKSIARINNFEYLEPENKAHFISLGIDSLIYPQKLAAREIVNLLKQTGTTEMFDFSGGKLSLYVIKLEEDAPIINKTLKEASSLAKNFDYRAVAITRDGDTIIPRGDDIFKVNDLIYVITNQSGVPDLMQYSGKKKIHIKNIMIMGGSRIGLRTAMELEDQFNIKLIEISRSRCNFITSLLKNTLLINGDGRDIELLEEEGIRKMDAFIAATGNSETNILSCLHAKQMGVKKTIAEVENIDYIDLADNIGVDTIINKKLIAASHISRFTMNAEVENIVCLTGADAEVLEFVVKENAKITKKPLKSIRFPKDAIIGGVIRGNSSFIATGNTEIKSHDKVVIFVLPSAMSKVEKYFN
ncbi:MAG: Trk system potassium transporter TrkA [Chlorobi bacterium]|nr:Trk system potassium transporter TrkA [Chlorobiota bacterium]